MLKKFFNKIGDLFSKPKGPVPFCRKDPNGDYYAYVNDQGGERRIGGPYSSCQDCKDNTGAVSCS